ncbi:MAG: hypothetical protein M0Q44_16735 [Methylobacter sp.]|jgi:hypothetical protein|nr:hypothetical protein [Methylobacter sp.]
MLLGISEIAKDTATVPEDAPAMAAWEQVGPPAQCQTRASTLTGDKMIFPVKRLLQVRKLKFFRSVFLAFRWPT